MRRRWLAALFVITALSCVEDDALARVGGGQSFSSGSGGGSGGSGSGGGGAEAELLFFLIRLCIVYPELGIPLLILFLCFVAAKVWMDQGSKKRSFRTQRTTHPPRARSIPGLKALQKNDQGFSGPVFADFVQMIFHRAYAARETGTWMPLTPFVSERVQEQLTSSQKGVSYSEIVLASSDILKVQHSANKTLVTIAFSGSRLETGKTRLRTYVEEEWTFQRAKDAVSLAPEDTLRLGCPSCGAAVETTSMGTCTNCDTPITAGQLQWQAIGMRVNTRKTVQAPSVSLTNGGEEPGYALPTLVDAEFPASVRKFQTRHPDFDVPAFQNRAKAIFEQLQAAWSDNAWQRARPHVTDPLYQSLRFWVERYERAGLRNQLTDVSLERQQMVKIELDAWYESITLRFWASCKDSVVDAEGTVVGGNAKRARKFSEYWTFVRTIGGADTITDGRHCPSCGAPLDNVSQSGVCGYCDSKITSGKFDWVLSKITQAEVYRG